MNSSNHVKIYLKFYNLSPEEFIPCLLCGKRACEIHHIIPRGRIFGKERDNIENLAALCHECHYMIHNKSSPSKFEKELKEKTLKLINNTKEKNLKKH